MFHVKTVIHVKRGKEGRSGTMCCQCLDVFVYFVVVVACMPWNE